MQTLQIQRAVCARKQWKEEAEETGPSFRSTRDPYTQAGAHVHIGTYTRHPCLSWNADCSAPSCTQWQQSPVIPMHTLAHKPIRIWAPASLIEIDKVTRCFKDQPFPNQNALLLTSAKSYTSNKKHLVWGVVRRRQHIEYKHHWACIFFSISSSPDLPQTTANVKSPSIDPAWLHEVPRKVFLKVYVYLFHPFHLCSY